MEPEDTTKEIDIGICQVDVLLKGLIEWQKHHLKQSGGIKEQMYNERMKLRGH